MHVGLDTYLSGKSYTLFNRKQGCWKCDSEARGLAEALGFDSSIQNLSMKRRKAEIDSTWLRGGRRSPVLERVLALLSLLHEEPSSRADSRQAPKLHSPLKAGSHSCFHTGTKTLRFQPGGQPRWLAGGLKPSPWLAWQVHLRCWQMGLLLPSEALAICNWIYLLITQNTSKADWASQMRSKGNFLIKELHFGWFITLADLGILQHL